MRMGSMKDVMDESIDENDEPMKDTELAQLSRHLITGSAAHTTQECRALAESAATDRLDS
jgi:hypothetical protein